MVNGLNLSNTEEWSDENLELLKSAVVHEQQRRWDLASAPGIIDQQNRKFLSALGYESGGAWVQPTGAHDAYPRGWEVNHQGKTWRSLIPGNVWEPGVSGWREATEPGVVAEWVQPTGAHDAYQTGERVVFDGKVYESVIDANVWHISDNPDGWELVVDEDPTEPETVEPEPELVPEYVQPTGAHDAYKKGERVTFEGKVYESNIDGNVWTPIAHPAGWTLIE